MSEWFWGLPVLARQVIVIVLMLVGISVFFRFVFFLLGRLSARTDQKNASRYQDETDEKYVVTMSGLQVQVWVLLIILGLMFAGVGVLSWKANPSDWDNTKMFYIIGGCLIGIALFGYLYAALWKISVDGCRLSVRSRHTLFLKKTLDVTDLDEVHHTRMYHQLDVKANGRRMALVNIASRNEDRFIRTLQRYGRYHEDQEKILEEVSKKVEKNLKKWN